MSFLERRSAWLTYAFEQLGESGVSRRAVSGRSLGIALQLVGKAMSNPGYWVELYDHTVFMNPLDRRRTLKKVQAQNVRKIVESLKLEGFEYDHIKLAIRFNLENK